MYSTNIDKNRDILNRWYKKFNEELFDNLLPVDTNIVIGVLTGTKQKSRFEPGVILGIDSRVSDVITFDGDIFQANNGDEVALELINRMLDQYDCHGYTKPKDENAPKRISSRGITSGSAYYNRTYKYEAENHGLLVRNLGSNGATHYEAYEINEHVKEIINADGGFFTSVRSSSTYTDKKTSRAHDWRGWCPKCKGQIIGGTKSPPDPVKCGFCDSLYIWEPRPHGKRKKKAA